MQWCVNVFSSSSSLKTRSISFVSFFMLFLFSSSHLPSSVQSQTISSCSPYLFISSIDPRSGHEYVQPCPIANPCRCLCEKESRRLWIDCFNRKLKTFPKFQSVPTNETIVEWNVDLAFNLFESITTSNQNGWLPKNIHIRHLVLSSSLAYDLIEQLNLTHRHLIDRWPSHAHLQIVNDFEEQVNMTTLWSSSLISHALPLGH